MVRGGNTRQRGGAHALGLAGKGLSLGLVGVAAMLILLAGLGISSRLSRPIANLAAAAAAIGGGTSACGSPSGATTSWACWRRA